MPSNSLARNPNSNKKRLPETLPTGTRCVMVHIPDDIEYVGYLLGALGRLSQQVFYDRDDAHTAKDVAALWNAANQKTMLTLGAGCPDCEGTNKDCPTCEGTGVRGGIAYFDDCECECEDEMCKLRIEENSSGGFFLVEDCGCGVLRKFQLVPAAVDPATGAVASGIDVIEPTTVIPSGVTDITAECYTSGLVDAMIESVKDYIDSIGGYLVTGLFNQSGASILVEYAQWFEAVRKGNIDINFSALGLTASEIKNAMDTQGVAAALTSRLNWLGVKDGSLNRFQIIAATVNLPVSISYPTPTAPYLQSWGQFVNLQQLNERAAEIADDCAGFTAPDSFTTEQALLDSGYTWAKVFDLTVAPLVENANFAINVFNGQPAAQWVEGQGYVNVPNLTGTPHCWNKLELNFPGNSAGNVHYVSFKYDYVPGGTDPNQECDLFQSSFDPDIASGGIITWTGNQASAGNVRISTNYVNNCTAPATAGSAKLSKIAFAGTGIEEYALLQQVSS